MQFLKEGTTYFKHKIKILSRILVILKQTKIYNLMRRKKGLTVFLCAFLLRFILGAIFFGSVDTTVTTKASTGVMAGGLVDNWPYFPMVHLFVWFGGILTLIPYLPLALALKLFPIVFDSLMAALIYDIIGRRNPQIGKKAAILYVLSPIAILINSFHGQTDSICLFLLVLAFYIRDYFKDSKIKFIIFGVLFTLSFIAKPVTLIFFVIFFEPFPFLKFDTLKRYAINQLCSIIGLCIASIISFSLFILLGYDLESMFAKVFDYSNTGFFMFGLPFSAPFDQFSFLRSRLWIMVIVGLVAIFYYFKKIDSFSLILFSFALTIGVAGLSPQYLIWLVPLLLINYSYRLSALYNIIGTAFLLLYYMNPLASSTHWENMATFAALKRFTWFMPPSLLSSPELMPVIRIIGDKIIPATGFLIALYYVVNLIMLTFTRGFGDFQCQVGSKSKLCFMKNTYLVFSANLYVILLTIFFIVTNCIDKSYLARLSVQAFDFKIIQYQMKEISPYVFAGNYESFSIVNTFNIVNILMILAVSWSIYAYYLGLVGIERNNGISEQA